MNLSHQNKKSVGSIKKLTEFSKKYDKFFPEILRLEYTQYIILIIRAKKNMFQKLKNICLNNIIICLICAFLFPKNIKICQSILQPV